VNDVIRYDISRFEWKCLIAALVALIAIFLMIVFQDAVFLIDAGRLCDIV